jgi:transposase InsO family protein
MKADVQRVLSTCEACQRTENAAISMRAPLIPAMAERPFKRVQIDMIGVAANSCGYTYILTIVDAFSRWTEAVPLTSKRAETMARAILTTWICQHGWMTILHSDNGTEFISETVAYSCDWLGVRRANTTRYHPQGNGLCERAIQAIKRAITAMVVEQGTKWHHALPWPHGAFAAPYIAPPAIDHRNCYLPRICAIRIYYTIGRRS